MSLRWKIAVAVGAMAALATLAVGVLSYRAASDRMYAEIDVSLAEAMRLPSSDGGGPFNWGPPSVSGPPTFYQAQVLGPDGSVRFSTTSGWDPGPDARSVVGKPRRSAVDTVTIGDSRYRVRTTGLQNGALQVARPLTELDRVLRSLRTRIVVLMILVTTAATLLGSLIAARVTATLRRLTAAADTVRTTGRLDVSVPRDGDDEVSRLGSAFGSMLETLDRSRAEQQRLVQDAGHELRTPLTSLRTNLDVLRRHPDLPDGDRAQIVDDLHREVAEMVDLVDEIVTVATGVATDEEPTEFSLGEALRSVVERFERRTARTFAVVADESPVRAQHAAVERAISNLLDNATKFDESGAPIQVRVTEGEVEVRDHGPGIPASDLDGVFDRFHRAAAARSMPGSGLGLSIVRDVVERNGGTVRAANADGGGAIVAFHLPVVLQS
jgi:two-component system, OmpR family, sensor histidine kinase MprB